MMKKRGSFLSGFLLGFLLGIIGLIIAIAIDEEETRKGAVTAVLVGIGITVVIMICSFVTRFVYNFM